MKRLIAILLTLVIAFSLVGCANSEKWYELSKTSYGYTTTYYINIDFEDLDVGTYNVIFKGPERDDIERPGILFVYEDQYDLVVTYTGAVNRDIGVTSFPK